MGDGCEEGDGLGGRLGGAGGMARVACAFVCVCVRARARLFWGAARWCFFFLGWAARRQKKNRGLQSTSTHAHISTPKQTNTHTTRPRAHTRAPVVRLEQRDDLVAAELLRVLLSNVHDQLQVGRHVGHQQLAQALERPLGGQRAEKLEQRLRVDRVHVDDRALDVLEVGVVLFGCGGGGGWVLGGVVCVGVGERERER